MRIERLILAMGPLAAMGLSSAALAAIDPIDAIGVCARISKKDARLECYDQVARDATSGQLQRSGPVASAPPSSWAAPPAPNAPAPRQPAAPAAPAATFGENSLRGSSGAADPDSIRAEVVSSTDNGLGQWRIPACRRRGLADDRARLSVPPAGTARSGLDPQGGAGQLHDGCRPAGLGARAPGPVIRRPLTRDHPSPA